MKTAMQEYIDWINEIYNSPISLTFSDVDFRTLEQYRNKAQSLLEKEKQQIIQAYDHSEIITG
jgi:tetrahydromethanopterin S-methyltransferase subunit H